MAMAAALPEAIYSEAVSEWLDAFEAALRSQDLAAAAALFLPDGHWRDLLAFTWHIQTITGI